LNCFVKRIARVREVRKVRMVRDVLVRSALTAGAQVRTVPVRIARVRGVGGACRRTVRTST
jgi:hypothetical protein